MANPDPIRTEQEYQVRLLGFVSYSTQKKTRLRATSLRCSLT